MSAAVRNHRVPAPAARWLEACRRHMNKQAGLGGSGTDVPFEQAFSNLASAYLKSKAPGLLDHEIGFQLLDRDEEDQKAVGMFGFDVGGQQLIAPVFWVNGDLKGHELLYIKDQDRFVPLKENWITYLVNRRPSILGRGIDRGKARDGIRPPELGRAIHGTSSFGSKAAAALPAWAAAALPGLAHAATSGPPAPLPRLLPAAIKDAGVRGVDYLAGLLAEHPTLAAPLDRTYGAALLGAIGAVKEAATRRPPAPSLLDPPAPARPRPPAKRAGAVAVVTYDQARSDRVGVLSEADRAAIVRDGYKVIDDRPDEATTRAFRDDIPATTTRVHVSPDETGLYDCMVKPGEVARCAVLIGPHGPDGRSGFATVIKAGDSPGERGWVNIHPGYVAVTKRHSDDDFRAWIERAGKPAADGVPTEEGRQFVALGPTGGTLPFIVEGEVGDPDGDYKVANVRFDLFAERPRPPYGLGTGGDRAAAVQLAKHSEMYDRWLTGERIHLGGRGGTKLRSDNGDLFVPNTMRIVEVEAADYPDDQWDAPEFEPEGFKRQIANVTGGLGRSENPPVVPMNGGIDADLGLLGKTAAVKVRFDGTAGHVDDGRSLSRAGMMAELVVGRGLREKAAAAILDECERGRYARGGPTRRYRFLPPEKAAAAGEYGGAGLIDQGPGAPGFPEPAVGMDTLLGSGYPSQAPQADSLPVPGMQGRDPSEFGPLYGPDPNAVDAMHGGDQLGQGDIIDAAAVGGLLRANRDDQLTDKYLPKLRDGLDSCGRILFNLYWHQDKLADRYGKTEVPELEDSVRNSFENLGDLVLNLQQKAVEADPQAEAGRVDLDDVD